MDPAALADALKRLPQCAQDAVPKAAKLSTCGLDLACLCTDTRYLAALQADLVKTCKKSELNMINNASRDMCLKVVPALMDNRQPQVIGVVATLMAIAIISVVLRLVARRLSKARFGMDDLFIVSALVFTLAFNACTLLEVHYGFGLHMVRMSLDDVAMFWKVNYAWFLLFGWAITFIKFSLLYLYHRIYPVKTFTQISIGVGIFMLLWLGAQQFSSIFACRPISYWWDKTIKGGECVDQRTQGYAISAFNILTDLAVLILPIPWLWKLQMKSGRKIGLSIVFVVGSFACVAGIVRIPFLVLINPVDITYTGVAAAVWCNVEASIGLSAACLPAMEPLLRRLPKLPPSLAHLLKGSSSHHSSTHPIKDLESSAEYSEGEVGAKTEARVRAQHSVEPSEFERRLNMSKGALLVDEKRAKGLVAFGSQDAWHQDSVSSQESGEKNKVRTLRDAEERKCNKKSQLSNSLPVGSRQVAL